MNIPALARYADIVSYDQARGAARALDWRGGSPAELGDVSAVAEALEAALVGGWAAAYLAGFGLALAARAWSARPSEARRGAVIQAAERLRSARPADRRLARMVVAALAQADAAILSGGDAEQALAGFVGAEIGRADRVAERCGRIAAGLLDDQDAVLVHGDAGPALAWMLAAAREEGKRPRLLVSPAPGAELVTRLAAELGVPAVLLDESTPQAVLAQNPGVCVVGAQAISLDGSVLVAAGGRALVALARASGLPRYALGYDGPEPEAHDGASLLSAAGAGEIVSAAEISAIVTTRGIYRPEMIARYLGDGEAPLDVIPLGLN